MKKSDRSDRNEKLNEMAKCERDRCEKQSKNFQTRKSIKIKTVCDNVHCRHTHTHRSSGQSESKLTFQLFPLDIAFAIAISLANRPNGNISQVFTTKEIATVD